MKNCLRVIYLMLIIISQIEPKRNYGGSLSVCISMGEERKKKGRKKEEEREKKGRRKREERKKKWRGAKKERREKKGRRKIEERESYFIF